MEEEKKKGDKENDESQLNDTNKTGEDDDEEEHNDEEDPGDPSAEKPDKVSLRSSLNVKIIGFKRLPNMEDELKNFHRFFTKFLEVEAPLIQIPGPDDKWVYFEMKSLEDRTKLFKYIRKSTWEGQKLAGKVVSIKPTTEVKEFKRMSVEEGLKILYPLQDTLYAQQLKSKHSAAKELLEKLIPKNNVMKYTKAKKYLKTIRLREMLPMHPIEGYESVVMVYSEQDPATGEIICGIRVISPDKESDVIVPLEQCISIPKQITQVAKKVATALPEVDIKPYNHTTKEGDLLAFTLRMTTCGSFMMTIVVPKVVALAFRQLTPEGVEFPEGEQKPEESYSALMNKKIVELKEKLGKFFVKEENSLFIESIYLVMAHPKNLMTSMEDSNSGSFHIVGRKHLPEKLNGINVRLSWERDGHVEVFRPLLSLIEAQGHINSSTRLYLASPYRLLGLYFAKRCAHVTMLYYWTKDNMNEHQQWAKQLGYHNIDFVNAKPQLRKKFPNENAVAIFWQFSRPALLDRFVLSEIRTVMFISYWRKNTQENYLNIHKKQLETVYSKMKISYICPFDLAPYKEWYGMAVFFNGLLSDPSDIQARKPKILKGAPVPTPLGKVPIARAGAGRNVNQFPRGPHFPKGQVSAFERLGPRQPYHRGYDDGVSNSWSRPDPWLGQSSAQFDQVASGMMQNLQAVSQQMQAFMMQGSQQNTRSAGPPEPSGWSNKRRYPEDFSDDDDRNPRWNNQRSNERQYSSYENRDFKRRREEPLERRPDDTGRWGASTDGWADRSVPPLPQSESRNTYSDQPGTWGSSVREPAYYEKGRTTSTGSGWNSTPAPASWNNESSGWNNTTSSWNTSANKYY